MSINRHALSATTTARTLDAGDHITPHRHAEHQIVYPSSGVAEVRTDSGNWIAPADRALWIPAGTRHEHRCYGPVRFHFVGFPAEQAAERTVTTVLAVQPLLRELIITCSAAEDPMAPESVRLRDVLLDQIRLAPVQPLNLPAARDDRLRNACALLESDISADWPLAELAHRVGASERTLSRLFRTELALTYPQWRTRLRLHRAVQLLADEVPVTTVAHRCGWATASAFIDVYRKHLGHTPGAFRDHRTARPEAGTDRNPEA